VQIGGFHPRTTLLDYLRLQERSTGTKEGCAEGDCGACTVAIGRVKNGRFVYEPVNACILLLGQVDGAEIVTVEDLAQGETLHPVQSAMVANHGSQCGFCTPGIVMSLFTLYQEGERPVSRQTANDVLAGNLCRCTGYRPIVDAALQACAEGPADAFTAARATTAERLATCGGQRGCVRGRRLPLLRGTRLRSFARPSLRRAPGRHHRGRLYRCGPVGHERHGGPRQGDLARPCRGLDVLEDAPDALTIGATVTHADAFAALGGIDPDLGELMRRFGSAQVRASGTVGGNIANGSPIGDLPPALIALGAELELASTEGVRRIPLDAFFIAYRQQDRRPGEYVRRVVVPKLKASEVFRAFKVSKRFDEDISSAMGAFHFTLDGRRIAAARIAFGGMAGTPKRAAATEAALAGASLDEPATWGAALGALSSDYQPMSDHRSSAAYRMTVARNVLLKALMEVASGTTRDTRIVGSRETLQAAE
jgi:xanthine dehydrogenase small subunit